MNEWVDPDNRKCPVLSALFHAGARLNGICLVGNRWDKGRYFREREFLYRLRVAYRKRLKIPFPGVLRLGDGSAKAFRKVVHGFGGLRGMTGVGPTRVTLSKTLSDGKVWLTNEGHEAEVGLKWPGRRPFCYTDRVVESNRTQGKAESRRFAKLFRHWRAVQRLSCPECFLLVDNACLWKTAKSTGKNASDRRRRGIQDFLSLRSSKQADSVPYVNPEIPTVCHGRHGGKCFQSFISLIV